MDGAALDSLTPAQFALRQVITRDSGPLTAPTDEDAIQWRLCPYIGGGGVDADAHLVITSWRFKVYKMHRTARINGAAIVDGVVLGESFSADSEYH